MSPGELTRRQQLLPPGCVHAGLCCFAARAWPAMNHPANRVEKNPKRPKRIAAPMARPNTLSMSRRVSGGGAGLGVDDDAIHTTSFTLVDRSPDHLSGSG